MKINEKMSPTGDSIFYSKSYMDMIEAHRDYIINHPETRVVGVESHHAVVYKSDLFSYLNILGVPMHLHWTIMRINNMFSYSDFNKDTVRLLIPNETVIDKLKQQLLIINK